ncbi:L-seryl-tRNA(Sec) selenium transferase [soil metagenome]
MTPTPAAGDVRFRAIPSVEKALQALESDPASGGWLRDLPRALAIGVVRQEVAALRQALAEDPGAPAPLPADALAAIGHALESLALERIRPTINGTGVILHTNLGRAPLPLEAAEQLGQIAGGYTNLEIDLASGKRGPRARFTERALALLCGAGAATVTNNCASALVLILRHFARPPRNEVIISRGQLVEIGGGFRIPEILETSGARLREVGSTNKTRLDDYARAINENTALILRVHRSNFYQEGFVGEPGIPELAELARAHNLPLVEDLGSGALFPTELREGLDHEPTPSEALGAGADLVCFSGDKLLGGPQAGIIAGRSDLVARLKKDPLFRALRCDRMLLAALQETAVAHLAPVPQLPVLSMLKTTPDELLVRARMIIEAAGSPPGLAPADGTARCGGGTMPRSAIPSLTLAVPGDAALAKRLRLGDPPVVGYLQDTLLKIDLRTVLPHQDAALARALQSALST